MPTDFAAATGGGRAGGNGVPFLVSSGIVFEIIAFACSSPQTAELNITTREATLMKWVRLGELLGAAFVIAAAIWDDKGNEGAILTGGAFAILASELFYGHAARSGKRKPGPPTEQEYTPQ